MSPIRTTFPSRFSPLASVSAIALTALIVWLAACSTAPDLTASCTDGERVLDVAFYAFFEPISYTADTNTASEGFKTHLGYEADLLTALEATPGAGLKFSRKPIAIWDDIWLLPAGPDFDIASGGITILDSRTIDASGSKAVLFTSGHVAFRQSLLVRAGDASRFPTHQELTDSVRVGVLPNTTGEHRLLRIVGLIDNEGTLTAGTRVETATGEIVADGSADYTITAAFESPNMRGRRHLYPPSKDIPQVVYLGEETGESELLSALREGTIDAVARGEIGNLHAAHAHPGDFEVTALDDKIELGGFTLAVADEELATCLNEKIDHLTDNGRIGYAEWQEDPSVFLRSAEASLPLHQE